MRFCIKQQGIPHISIAILWSSRLQTRRYKCRWIHWHTLRAFYPKLSGSEYREEDTEVDDEHPVWRCRDFRVVREDGKGLEKGGGARGIALVDDVSLIRISPVLFYFIWDAHAKGSLEMVVQRSSWESPGNKYPLRPEQFLFPYFLPQSYRCVPFHYLFGCLLAESACSDERRLRCSMVYKSEYKWEVPCVKLCFSLV